jgi:uncharacterized membrane protein
MKTDRTLRPYVILALAWLALAAGVWWSAQHLPERVATHFGPDGAPNGWQTRAGYVQFMLIFSAAVPASILGVFAIIRHCNGWGLNIPYKSYWLAPERREETMDFVQRQRFWLVGGLLVFLAVVHWSIVDANAHATATLPQWFFLWVGVFLLVMMSWSVSFLRHFSRKPA